MQWWSSGCSFAARTISIGRNGTARSRKTSMMTRNATMTSAARRRKTNAMMMSAARRQKNVTRRSAKAKSARRSAMTKSAKKSAMMRSATKSGLRPWPLPHRETRGAQRSPERRRQQCGSYRLASR